MIFNAMKCDECHKITPINENNWHIRVSVAIGAYVDTKDAGVERALSLSGHYCSTSCIKAKLDRLERERLLQKLGGFSVMLMPFVVVAMSGRLLFY